MHIGKVILILLPLINKADMVERPVWSQRMVLLCRHITLLHLQEQVIRLRAIMIKETGMAQNIMTVRISVMYRIGIKHLIQRYMQTGRKMYIQYRFLTVMLPVAHICL